MKIRFCAALLLAALSITLFAGCTAAAGQQLDTLEDAVENRLDAAEDAIESRLEAVITDAPVPMASAPAVPATEPIPAPTQPASADPNLITKEEATAIALKDAGLTEDQVTRLRTEFDYDDGRPEFEVDFHHGGYEYDYEIDAESGRIISRDKDLDD